MSEYTAVCGQYVGIRTPDGRALENWQQETDELNRLAARIAELGRENAVLEVMCYYLAQCLHMREPEHSTSWLLSEARRLCEEDLADEAEEREAR